MNIITLSLLELSLSQLSVAEEWLVFPHVVVLLGLYLGQALSVILGMK